MTIPSKLLVANRGEIAIRVMRTAAELGIQTVAVYSEDDAQALHSRMADHAHPLNGSGAAAYLDGSRLIEIASESGCDALHPGYGFLSENAEFSQACAERGLTFVGPSIETLALFGDKGRARDLAYQCGVPVLPGLSTSATLEDAKAFFAAMDKSAAMIIKAIAGGGGRGMRIVRNPDELEEAYTRCRSEALRAFGKDDVYVEQFIPRARHIEVQVLGDGSGEVSHLGERDCSIQRRHQKLVEIAPAPELPETLRDRLTAAAVAMAQSVKFLNLGTFEFLIDTGNMEGESAFAFIEANPRLQVEHTVTEEVTGLDLVALQLQLAGGANLESLGLTQQKLPRARGYAIQLRVNMEVMDGSGNTTPSGGVLSAFEAPSGPGVRVDTLGYAGYATSPNFDSLLAKVIVRSASPVYGDVVAKAYRALCEFRVEGIATNIPFLQNLLRNADFVAHRIDTQFVEANIGELAAQGTEHQRHFVDASADSAAVRAGVKVDAVDPLAVLNHGKDEQAAPSGSASVAAPAQAPAPVVAPDGTVPIGAPMQGTIVSVDVGVGESIHASQQLLVMEAMKMEHIVTAGHSGTVRRLVVNVGDTVFEGSPLAFIEEGEVELAAAQAVDEIDLDEIRADLAEVLSRQSMTRDAARPDAVARRRKTGQRTARENIYDLCDEGSFVEYGSLVIAARRQRMSLDELIKRTPADGMITGVGHVNGDQFEDEDSRCMIVSYDYTVLAGTQGIKNHEKKDRVFELTEKWRLPLIFFTEGGGGRPGDTDGGWVAGLNCMAFHLFARLSGLVPLVGINSGRCFAGNAAMLGCCDVIIATQNSAIGMGGPAMIEGGGLGVFKPEEVGPMDVQVPNGVVDIAVADEAEAVAVAKKYISYFQGAVKDWTCADQRLLRRVIPENRLRIYDVREVIDLLADTDSVLEIRRHFGLGMVTALARIEGRPIGIIANNPSYLAGAIDSDGADKAARFIQLCDAFDIPMLSLADTPGMMVGPEIEKTALVRHCCRLFVNGANVSVPTFTVILRKGYGLGVQAMAGGSFAVPFFTVSWPTGEFGGMGLEGAVKLGFRNELAAIEDPQERKAKFDEMVAEMYEIGKAINTASHFELDDVIDPAETRNRIMSALRSIPPPPRREGKKRPSIDTW